VATYVLVHGGFHDGSCFAPVAERLRAAGHAVHCPDLPAHGGLGATTEHVAALLGTLAAPVVLAGHSLGGITVSCAAEAVPERIAALVYVCAALLPSGESIESFRARFFGPDAPGSEAERRGGVRVRGDALWIDPATALELYYHRSPGAAPRLRPQPVATMRDPVRITPERWGRLPRTYVLALDDRGIPPAYAEYMLEQVGADRVVRIDCDHSPFASAPDRLTEILLSEPSSRRR
jgi:pimeloyl-ACP methyl ester carboxylesterase